MKAGKTTWKLFFAGILFVLSLLLPSGGYAITGNPDSLLTEAEVPGPAEADSAALSIYRSLDAGGLSFNVFRKAFYGYLAYKQRGLIGNDHILTIIDFDKTSVEKRLFIIDLKNRRVVHNTYVAHGRNSGGLVARDFSNVENSRQSSLGFYLTADTYYGKHGLSLRLDGLQKGINDKARKRNIVVHSADYVSESFISKYNRLGRSWGCPALPREDFDDIIRLIKNRSLLFIYSSKAE